MIRNWKRYTIMHKNRRVASIREDGTCTVYARRFLPYNIYLEDTKDADIDTRLNNRVNFEHWCSSRVLSLDRTYAKEILNSLGRKQAVTDRERAEISIAYHGLSLTDVYWIKGDRESVSFEEINLYTHSLSDAFVDVALRGKQLTAQNAALIHPNDSAGDVSTMGVAPKAWIRRNGSFYLLKDGSERDVKAELLASRIARCFNVNQVLYEADTYDGQIVSSCRIITGQDVSLINMESVEVFAENRNTTATEIVMKKDAYGYHMMNIVDYLVGNTDRHWGNWGFSVDNSTNKLLGLYPLMDFNKAFNAYDTVEGARCQTMSGNVSQKDAAILGVHAVGLNQIAEIDGQMFEDSTQLEMFRQRLDILRQENDKFKGIDV